MRVLVTGANGLLGQKLVALFQTQKEIELLATGRGVNRNPPGGYSYFQCDLTKRAEVDQLFAENRPEAVIHGQL